MKCINHTHADYIALNEVVSDRLLLDAVINKWQEDNKSDAYPTVKEVVTLLNSSNIPYYSKDFKDGAIQFKKKANEVDFVLRSVELLNSDKAKQVFAKGEKNKWDIDKILLEMGIPKLQKQIILSLGKTNREDIITDLLANYSYTVEINISKEETPDYDMVDTTGEGDFEPQEFIPDTDLEVIEDADGNPIDVREVLSEKGKKQLEERENKRKPTQYYSNLTVPGGTNYTENEIATPGITPSIKGHAEFATDNGIGWFRSDEEKPHITYAESFEEIKDLENKGYQKIGLTDDGNPQFASPNPKTRRILEVQSDLFQKGRDNEYLIGNMEYSVEELGSRTPKDMVNSNNFLQLLNKDNNWVTFFVKSIIQDTAKQTITEVQESDVEAKVRELEKEGLLEIDCKGKLKAEKGLQTNFTKGGKWKLLKDLKGYPTHKEGGVDLTIGKDGVKIKNSNTEFIAKHGLVIPKN